MVSDGDSDGIHGVRSAGRTHNHGARSHGARSRKLRHVLNTLFEEGKVVPVIDRTYPLAETAEAYRYFATGSTKGKLVITVDQA